MKLPLRFGENKHRWARPIHSLAHTTRTKAKRLPLLPFRNAAGAGSVGHRLDALTTTSRDAAERLDRNLIRIGHRPIQSRRILFDDFVADLVIAHFQPAQCERRRWLRIDVYGDRLLRSTSWPFGSELVRCNGPPGEYIVHRYIMRRRRLGRLSAGQPSPGARCAAYAIIISPYDIWQRGLQLRLRRAEGGI
jgi:hypothetical protein